MTGYRRLEDAIRSRTGLTEHGASLFGQVFNVSSPKLTWKGLENGERAGRLNLFNGAYLAHRNPRAHREPDNLDPHQQLSEFLLLNHLYLLERDAIEV